MPIVLAQRASTKQLHTHALYNFAILQTCVQKVGEADLPQLNIRKTWLFYHRRRTLVTPDGLLK